MTQGEDEFLDRFLGLLVVSYSLENRIDWHEGRMDDNLNIGHFNLNRIAEASGEWSLLNCRFAKIFERFGMIPAPEISIRVSTGTSPNVSDWFRLRSLASACAYNCNTLHWVRCVFVHQTKPKFGTWSEMERKWFTGMFTMMIGECECWDRVGTAACMMMPWLIIIAFAECW